MDAIRKDSKQFGLTVNITEDQDRASGMEKTYSQGVEVDTSPEKIRAACLRERERERA